MNDKAIIKDASNNITNANHLAKSMLTDLDGYGQTLMKQTLLNIIRVMRKYIAVWQFERNRCTKRGDKRETDIFRRRRLEKIKICVCDNVYDIRTCIKNLLASIDQICQMISELNGSLSVKVGIVNINTQANYLHLKDIEIDTNNDDYCL